MAWTCARSALSRKKKQKVSKPRPSISLDFCADAERLSIKDLAAKYHRPPGTVWSWREWVRKDRREREQAESTHSREDNQHQSPQPPPSPEIITIRPEVYTPRAYSGDKQPQTQVLLLSDAHAGAQTPSYNPDIFKSRLRKLYDDMVLIRTLQTKQHPLEELVIFSLGDQIQGENVGIQMNLDEFGMTVYDQVYKLWVPAMTEFMVNLTGQYRTIKWYGCRGNHGCQRDRRLASKSNNWDNIAQNSLAAALSKYPQITFDIEPTEWYKLVTVRGWKFMLMHGDVIRTHSQPFSGITTRSGDWQVIFDPDVMCMGHFHSPSKVRPRDIPIFVNGTFKSDDAWAIGAIGKSGPPVQITFGVHDERAITWDYWLDLDMPKERS